MILMPRAEKANPENQPRESTQRTDLETDMTDPSPPLPTDVGHPSPSEKTSFVRRLLVGLGQALGLRRDRATRDSLEELIEETVEDTPSIDEDERRLIANILDLEGTTISDVMVPRADIIALPSTASLSDIIDMVSKEGHSRFPVYRDQLDDTIGMIHVKDVLAWRGAEEAFSTEAVLRKALFVAPSMEVLELLLEMRVSRVHMALVVDEYGGVDGLVTIEDLVEEIIGEIEDEHDRDDTPVLMPRPDGSLIASARVALEDLEALTGPIFSEEEYEEVDTLGGLVFSIAGRVPLRGELIRHDSGLEFQVMDVDPRRIKKLRVRLGGLKSAAPAA